jgi:hypothetical protein
MPRLFAFGMSGYSLRVSTRVCKTNRKTVNAKAQWRKRDEGAKLSSLCGFVLLAPLR